MKKIIQWIIPKDDKFFEMLKEQADCTVHAAEELKIFVENYHDLERSQRKSKSQSIKEIEIKGGEISHNIITKLSKNPRTKVDKEDIYKITVLLDNVLDFINAIALRFVILSLERIDDYIIRLVDILRNVVTELNKIISDLKKTKDVKFHCSNIIKLEDNADEIYHEALSELFHFYKNSIDIIKYKEVYELLENCIDKCKEIANVLENVAIKHA